jgi:putative transposase
MQELIHSRTCVHALHAHLVFVTKYRRKALTSQMLEDLSDIIKSECVKMDALLVEMQGEADHVHLLVRYPPKVCLSVLVNRLKGVSSRRPRQGHSALARRFWGGHMWSPSYFAASCGGALIDIIRKYIESQNTPS